MNTLLQQGTRKHTLRAIMLLNTEKYEVCYKYT